MLGNILANGNVKKKLKINEWKPLTLQELKNFVALAVFMGLDENYWAKRRSSTVISIALSYGGIGIN